MMESRAPHEFAKRRRKIIEQIGKNGIAIIAAKSESVRNGDVNYPYRQDSYFYYLTGFTEPEAIAVLIPFRQEGEFILFNQPHDTVRELWDGPRAGQDGACEIYGADQSYPISDFDHKLPDLLQGCERLHYAMGRDANFDARVMSGVNHLREKVRSGEQIPREFINIEHTLAEMRLYKSAAEIALMRQAAHISAEAHKHVMQLCKPGLHEYDLEAELIGQFLHQGSRAVAYESIVGGGANACTLHYRDNTAILRDGDLVLIDAGCEYQHYASDITRTFPVNGRFNPEQKAIYELVLAAQSAGIEQVRPGVSWQSIQELIVRILTQGLVDLHILHGAVDNLIEHKAYSAFYMHRSGHWLGLDVHDVGEYKVQGEWRPLEPGFVLTVEPGIYIAANAPQVDKKWWNIGVRIEDDVLVTETGHEVLSISAPRSVADIEALMAHRNDRG